MAANINNWRFTTTGLEAIPKLINLGKPFSPQSTACYSGCSHLLHYCATLGQPFQTCGLEIQDKISIPDNFITFGSFTKVTDKFIGSRFLRGPRCLGRSRGNKHPNASSRSETSIHIILLGSTHLQVMWGIFNGNCRTRSKERLKSLENLYVTSLGIDLEQIDLWFVASFHAPGEDCCRIDRE